MIPPEAKAAMQGAVPSILATCNPDGTPNVTPISQVWYVDERHIAVSFQFFNKTSKNVRGNPQASLRLCDPATFDRWVVQARFVRSETEGDVFEEMDMQLEAIASMTGMSGVFKLQAADVYEVLSIERVPMVLTSS